MAAPLTAACQALLSSQEPERERVLVLVTDGQVGNEDQILAALGAELQHIRAFTVGIDRAVNEGFLRRLATLGAGAMELVEGEARLDEAMDRIHRKLGTPLLTDVTIHGEGMDIDATSLTPDRIAAVFAGCPLEVAGRYTEHAALERSAIVVTAKDATGRRFSQSLAPQRTNNPALGRMWARSRVRALEDRYTATGGDAHLEAELVSVSLEFSVLCRFTAFVAVDSAEVVNRGGKGHKVTQAVEAPSGWSERESNAFSEGFTGGAPAPAPLAKAEAAAPPRGPARSQIETRAVRAAPGSRVVAKKSAPPPAMQVSQGANDGANKGRAREEALNLSAYARRAEELVRVARTLDVSDPNAVALFMVRVRALVEDLLSLSMQDEQIDALKRELLRFEDAYARIDLATAAAKATLETLREALLVFSATSTGPAEPGKQKVSRQGFWKRSPRA
jgi:Ca-activated chloride channel family protein